MKKFEQILVVQPIIEPDMTCVYLYAINKNKKHNETKKKKTVYFYNYLIPLLPLPPLIFKLTNKK